MRRTSRSAPTILTSCLSTFGVMFTPNQDKAASETLARVQAEGTKIGLANWTPDGFIGQVFQDARQITCRRPPGTKSPALVGHPAPRLTEMFDVGGAVKAEIPPIQFPLPLAGSISSTCSRTFLRPGAEGVRRNSETGKTGRAA